MDKSWMRIRSRKNPEYLKGVDDFIEFAITHMGPGETKIKCPCWTCNNCDSFAPEEVKEHMKAWGIVTSYDPWTNHGEDDTEENSPTYNSQEMENGNDKEDMQEILEDIQNEGRGDKLNGMHNNDDGSDPPIADNAESKKFSKLMKDAEQKLYPGCESFSKLSFVVKLLHIKLMNRISDKAIKELLEFMIELLPPGAKIPKSYQEARKVTRKLGLTYKKIHVCKNDCILFWKDYENEDKCPTCETPRYNFHKGKGRSVPHKVLRYFPLKPRLRRLFASRMTSTDMRWHKEVRKDEENILRHPADSVAWKEFDKQHESFASDPRNVRLGLASDGFTPFTNLKKSYSMWPVILVPYNLPPWKCMKEEFFMMSLLIPGRKAPGNDIDVFLQPLIDDLEELWIAGMRTYDATSEDIFCMRVALLWTINDCPAYANLSGWSTKGKLACPSCNKDASYQYLHHGRKVCYMGHARFLPENHKFRRSQYTFNENIERRHPPKLLSGEDVMNQLENVEQPVFGKMDKRGKKRKRTRTHLNWSKRSIFFQLPYWKTNKIRHNLDIMHIEKNVCDNIVGTLLNLSKKTKDTYKARLDMEELGIRPDEHLEHINGDTYIPPASYTLSKAQIKGLLEFFKSVKFPDGYASNISSCVNLDDCSLTGLKSHDCHVLLQTILPIGLRGFLPKAILKTLSEFSSFFKQLTSKNLNTVSLEKLDNDIVIILCKLEKVFPPAFFTVMIHLSVHVASEALIGGPVHYRWMYPFERFMKTLKDYVRNKAHPEGCIAEGYIDRECISFCSMYFDDMKTKFNKMERNHDGNAPIQNETGISVFDQKIRGLGAKKYEELSIEDIHRAHFYVLNNCDQTYDYIQQHKEELKSESNRNIEKRHQSEFQEWLVKRVTQELKDGRPGVTENLLNLVEGPEQRVYRHRGCVTNGLRFRTQESEKHLRTQNSGVVVKSYHQGKTIDFYGVINDIIELIYLGDHRVFIIKCDWWDLGSSAGILVDSNSYISVNVKRTWYKEDPFILAFQADQVSI